MKYGVLAAILAGVIGMLSIDQGVLVTQTSSAMPTVETSGRETFTLRARGSGESCLVEKAAGSVAELDVEPACEAVLPGLSRVRHWQERDDGSVVFSTDGSETVVSFSVADGVTYESFEPQWPLISLIAEN